MEYPKKFDVCPNCGSMNRVIEQEAMAEAVKGNTKTMEKVGVISFQTTIFDPKTASIIAPKEFPVIITRFDVCADCGILYCVELDKGIGKATPQIRRDDHMRHPFQA
jgi:predicted ATP-dependent serine protease